MARNKMEDLRNHIFASLERLNDDQITAERLEIEVKKAKTISLLAGTVVETARVEIEFLEAVGANGSNSSLFKEINPQKLIS